MKSASILAAAALLCHASFADTQLTMTDNFGEDDGEGKTVISVRDGKVAMQDKAGDSLALYDSQTGTFTQVDHQSQTYMVMDDAMMDEAASQMSEMMKQMEAQLASLPAEQREAMMKMMPGMADRMAGNGKPAAAVKVEWTGKTDKVAGFDCKVAAVTEPDGERSEACVATPDELGMTADDYKAVVSMFEKMQSFAQRFGTGVSMPSAEELGGVPIRVASKKQGASSQLLKVSTADLDGELFEVPASYRQRTMMDSGR